MQEFTKTLSGTEDERAVSPVIGVILLIAITVILAAVIAAFVLDMGPGGADPTAGVAFSEDTDSGVTVTWQSQGQNDGELYVYCDGDVESGTPQDITAVGASTTCASPSGDEIVVMAERSGTTGVVDRYAVD